MLSAGVWTPNQPNTILFVLTDTDGNEVAAIGDAFTLELSKAGAAFAGSAGTKAEISDGWYSYTSTAGEADTPGPVAVKVTHASTVQQNLEYVIETRVVSGIEFTYTLTESDLTPIAGANIWITTDSGGADVVWVGVTDMLGVARDGSSLKPRLIAGTYYVWASHPSYTFSTNPDVEVVS